MKFLIQEFFNQTKITGHSTIVCGQCSLENWDSLYEVKVSPFYSCQIARTRI